MYLYSYTLHDLLMTRLLFRSLWLPAQSDTTDLLYCTSSVGFCFVQINRQVNPWFLKNDNEKNNRRRTDSCEYNIIQIPNRW